MEEAKKRERERLNSKFIAFLILLLALSIRRNAWTHIISFLMVQQSVILKFYYLKQGIKAERERDRHKE